MGAKAVQDGRFRKIAIILSEHMSTHRHTHTSTVSNPHCTCTLRTMVPAAPSMIFKVTVRSHPRVTVVGSRSSSTHTMAGPADSDTITGVGLNMIAADPAPPSPVGTKKIGLKNNDI